MTPDEFAHKLWYAESDGRLYDAGDDGRAIWAYQVHIDWVFDWAHRLEMAPALNERFNDFAGRLVRAFYQWHQDNRAQMTPVQVAMHFHIGHIVFEIDDEWDEVYATRFEGAP